MSIITTTVTIEAKEEKLQTVNSHSNTLDGLYKMIGDQLQSQVDRINTMGYTSYAQEYRSDTLERRVKMEVRSLTGLLNLIPQISYIKVDPEVKTGFIVHVEIKADSSFDDYDFFTCVSNPIHKNFNGLNEYIDSSIVINNTTELNKIDIYFMEESRYIPFILFSMYNRSYPKDAYDQLLKNLGICK